MISTGLGEHVGCGLLLRKGGGLGTEGPHRYRLDGSGRTKVVLEVGTVVPDEDVYAMAAAPVHVMVVSNAGDGESDVEIDLLVDLLDPNMPFDISFYKQR